MKANKAPTARQVPQSQSRVASQHRIGAVSKYGMKRRPSRISARHRLSVGTFYHYYKSKDDLMELVCKRVEVVAELMEDTEEKSRPLLPIYQFRSITPPLDANRPCNGGQIYRIFDACT
jgi:hypothetical protein